MLQSGVQSGASCCWQQGCGLEEGWPHPQPLQQGPLLLSELGVASPGLEWGMASLPLQVIFPCDRVSIMPRPSGPALLGSFHVSIPPISPSVSLDHHPAPALCFLSLQNTAKAPRWEVAGQLK